MDLLKWLFESLFSLSFDDTPFNVMTTLNLDLTIPEHWDTKVRLDSERKEFWNKFEGKEASNMPIIRRDDFVGNPGDVAHIDVRTNLRTVGVSGETILKGKEGKLTFGQFDLKVDWIRNAVGFNRRGEKRSFINAMQMASDTLSTWLAKTKDDECFGQLLDLAAQTRRTGPPITSPQSHQQ